MIVVVAISVTACGGHVAVIAPSASIWNNPTAVIGVAVAPLPQAGTYKAGAQGMLDLAINESMSQDPTAHLQKFDAGSFRQTQVRLIEKLTARGLTVKAIQVPIDPKQYPELSGAADGKRVADHDYTALHRSLGIDRLLLVQLAQVGTRRNYYGFIPTSAPSALARVTAQMIDLKTGTLLWSTASQRACAIATPWDEPPGYVNVDRAIVAAMNSAGSDVINDLAY